MTDTKTPEQMAEEAAKPRWIGVKEGLPDPDKFVLAYRWTTGEWVRAECIVRSDGGRRWLFNGVEFYPGMDNITCWLDVPMVPTACLGWNKR